MFGPIKRGPEGGSPCSSVGEAADVSGRKLPAKGKADKFLIMSLRFMCVEFIDKVGKTKVKIILVLSSVTEEKIRLFPRVLSINSEAGLLIFRRCHRRE